MGNYYTGCGPGAGASGGSLYGSLHHAGRVRVASSSRIELWAGFPERPGRWICAASCTPAGGTDSLLAHAGSIGYPSGHVKVSPRLHLRSPGGLTSTASSDGCRVLP